MRLSPAVGLRWAIVAVCVDSIQSIEFMKVLKYNCAKFEGVNPFGALHSGNRVVLEINSDCF